MYWMRLLRRSRRETGATTAEYVGIVAFVGLLIVAVLAFTTPIADKSDRIVRKAFCLIAAQVGGGGGCGSADNPYHEPDDCRISAFTTNRSGKLSLIADLGAGTGHALYRERVLGEDGSVSDRYIVRTNGEGEIGWSPGLGGGLDTGKGGVGEEITLSVGGEGKYGQTYEFDSQEDAQEFIDAYGDWGMINGHPDGYEPQTRYLEGTAAAEVEGEYGPLTGEAGKSYMIGAEETLRGPDKGSLTVTLAMTREAALSAGVPLPVEIVEASVRGDLSMEVSVSATFSPDGKLMSVEATGVGKVQASGGLNLDVGLGKATGKNGKDASLVEASAEGLPIPDLRDLQAGRSVHLTMKTSFVDENGNYTEAASVLGDALAGLTRGHLPGEEAAAALREQLTEHSQYNVSTYDYSKDSNSGGGRWSTPLGSFGLNYTQIETNEDLIDSLYYNPQSGTWEQNLVCDE